MTELKLISPMLDDFEVGGFISDHDGVKCYPAMRKNTDERYIVKVISVPASQTKLEALLLTGAYSSKESALCYFEALANEIADEKRVLDDLAQLEGFVAYTDIQIEPKDDATGYDVYLLGEYRTTLERHIAKNPLTQLAAVNLGLDLCSALSICRRSGYICTDIKPSNIALTGDKEYRICDLGFTKLSSLQYASLPDKYRSAYTAPEVEDAFSALNETIDIYAVGLVLYQVFNEGKLPFDGDVAPNEVFASPICADAEMSEIILKACNSNPAERWQDPVQMGQALVSYMQKNGVSDTPLTVVVADNQDAETSENLTDAEEALEHDALESPVTEETSVIPSEESAETLADQADVQAAVTDSTTESDSSDDIIDAITAAINDPIPVETEATTVPEELTEQIDDAVVNQEPAEDDEVEQLVIEEIYQEDSLAEEILDEEIAVDYNEISEELSDILNQVDELAAHQVPDPPVAPEPIEIVVPEPQEEQRDAPEQEDPCSETAETVQNAEEDTQVAAEEITEETPYIPKKKRTGLKWCIALLIIIGLLVGGYFFYYDYYLQPIHTLELTGVEDRLQVQLTSDMDETYLTVVCADSHGNKIPAPVVGGTAVFSGLLPDTAYTVSVEVAGLHKLTGITSKVYSTPVQTKIAQISIVTGAENGSVILSFAVEGPDSDQWNVIYSAEGEAERVTTFPAHMVTLTGLTTGKDYTFRLEPVDEIYLNGEAEANYVVKDVVYAENLRVTACTDGILTAQWESPSGAAISQWSVRCYNDAGYDATVVTEEPAVTFENIDDTSGYTVEVTAAQMSVNRRVVVSPNSVTVTDFTVDASNGAMLQVNWNTNRENADGEWTLQYTIDGVNAAATINTRENAAQIPIVPGGIYVFSLLDGSGNPVLGGPFVHAQEDAVDFEGFSVTKSNMTVRLCKTPSSSGWSYKDLKDEDYINTFAVGQKISAVIALSGRVERSDNNVFITYAIRDESGKLVVFSHDTQTWRSMWYENYCELDIPGIPTNLGTYELTVFFNGQTVGTQKFIISA